MLLHFWRNRGFFFSSSIGDIGAGGCCRRGCPPRRAGGRSWWGGRPRSPGSCARLRSGGGGRGAFVRFFVGDKREIVVETSSEKGRRQKRWRCSVYIQKRKANCKRRDILRENEVSCAGWTAAVATLPNISSGIPTAGVAVLQPSRLQKARNEQKAISFAKTSWKRA